MQHLLEDHSPCQPNEISQHFRTDPSLTMYENPVNKKMMPMLYGGVVMDQWCDGGVLPFEFLDLATGTWSGVTAEYASYAVPITTEVLWRIPGFFASSEGKLFMFAGCPDASQTLWQFWNGEWSTSKAVASFSLYSVSVVERRHVCPR